MRDSTIPLTSDEAAYMRRLLGKAELASRKTSTTRRTPPGGQVQGNTLTGDLARLYSLVEADDDPREALLADPGAAPGLDDARLHHAASEILRKIREAIG